MVRVRLRIALLLATAVIAALTVMVLGPARDPSGTSRAEQAAATCADDLLIAVPGGNEGGQTHPVQVGSTAGIFTNAYEAAATAGNETVQLDVVDYASQNAAVLRPRTHATSPANQVITKAQVLAWRVGIAAAASRTVAAMTTAASSCPQQNIVLVGYSQGAMAVHRALLSVASTPAIADRIVGAMLISDGNRTKGTQALLGGTPPAPRSAQGIDDARVAHFADVPYPALTGKVFSMCRQGDVVCNFGSTPAATAIKDSRSYRTGPDALKIAQLATGLSIRAQRIPRPDPAVDTFSTMVNLRVDRQLVADVLPSDTSLLRWTLTSGLPPGLTLGSTGLLQGVPTVAGTWTIRYTVKNTRGSLYSRPVPGSIVITVEPSTAASLSAGGQNTCLVKTNGTLFCWGLNTWAQVGDKTTVNRTAPTRMGQGVTWTSVSTSGSHTCGINEGGTMYCWGLNNYGQLGTGNTTGSTGSRLVTGGLHWSAVSTNWFQTCAVTTGHAAYCWGLNSDGQLGDGTKTTRLSPTRVGVDSNWATISAGGWSTCGTRTSGTLWCWGANDFGQLGDGTTTARLKPVQVGSATTWARASTGWMHSCGFTATGFALCWGFNSDGEDGVGTTVSQLRPVNVGIAGPWIDISVGDGFSCGIRSDNSTWCWGDNPQGQLGTGNKVDSLTPVQVAGAGSAARVVNGFSHTCDLQTDNGVQCWGNNDAGQLGDATNNVRLVPTPVSGG